MTNNYDEFMEFAKGVALRAGDIMVAGYEAQTYQVYKKADNSPVTEVDTKINALVISAVSERFPEHGVHGEEESYNAGVTKVWVCDPMDGTRQFVTGDIGSCVFSLTYVVAGVPVVAVVYNPFLRQTYTAQKGKGSFVDGRPLHVSQKTTLEGAAICAPHDYRDIIYYKDFYDLLVAKGASVQTGSLGTARMCMIAQGLREGLYFPATGAHDVAAAKLIIEEAGGRVTDLFGAEQSYAEPIRGAIVSNGLLHDEMQAIIDNYGQQKYLVTT